MLSSNLATVVTDTVASPANGAVTWVERVLPTLVIALPAFLKLFSRFLVACSPCLPILLRTLLAWSTALTIISITSDIHSPPSSSFYHLSENIAFSFPSPSPSYSLRSEEHTSELQSRENLVCRLLLEKQKVLSDSDP